MATSPYPLSSVCVLWQRRSLIASAVSRCLSIGLPSLPPAVDLAPLRKPFCTLAIAVLDDFPSASASDCSIVVQEVRLMNAFPPHARRIGSHPKSMTCRCYSWSPIFSS